MLSLVRAKQLTSPKSFFKTVSCLLSKKFHILIVLSLAKISPEPEIINLLFRVTATQ